MLTAFTFPPLNSTVLYQGSLYQVRNGTRNKTTKAITLWLCTCHDTLCLEKLDGSQGNPGSINPSTFRCQHTKTPAASEEVTRIPQPTDRICHFSARKAYTLMAYKTAFGSKVLFEVKDDSGITQMLPLTEFDLLPEVGDRVLVAAGPYCNWIRARAKPLRGHEPYPSWEHRQLIESLDDFSWMVSVFEVRAVKEGVAVCVGDSIRRELPVECLRVIEKRHRQAQEERKAA